jgi:glycerol uptake facilitator-like aquaporin
MLCLGLGRVNVGAFGRDVVLLEPGQLVRRVFAEYLGSLLLAAIVIGSGIAAQTLSPHAIGLELLENAAATGVGLYVLIVTFGPISGAHFNPVISFVDALFNGIAWRTAWCYFAAQVAGCVSGAVLANLMFSRSAITLSTDHRGSLAHGLSEVVATSGLVLVIFALARTHRTSLAPAAVGSYIACAYFFTSSTSFANPAVVVGRMFSNSFAGIAPTSAPLFVGAEVVGGLVAIALVKFLFGGVSAQEASIVTVVHDTNASEGSV